MIKRLKYASEPPNCAKIRNANIMKSMCKRRKFVKIKFSRTYDEILTRNEFQCYSGNRIYRIALRMSS